MPSFNRIKETCLYVKDLDATREFYQNKLGLTCFKHEGGRHVFFEIGDDVLLCFNADITKVHDSLPSHYGEGYMHLAFECPKEEYEDWKEKCQNAGIAIEHEEDWGEGQLSFYFRDPDNHLLEVVMPGLWKHLVSSY